MTDDEDPGKSPLIRLNDGGVYVFRDRTAGASDDPVPQIFEPLRKSLLDGESVSLREMPDAHLAVTGDSCMHDLSGEFSFVSADLTSAIPVARYVVYREATGADLAWAMFCTDATSFFLGHGRMPPLEQIRHFAEYWRGRGESRSGGAATTAPHERFCAVVFHPQLYDRDNTGGLVEFVCDNIMGLAIACDRARAREG